MRIALLTLLFSVMVTATAQARLGETADQLLARYGQPLTETDQKRDETKLALSYVVFQKGGFQINVTISNGISVEEKFTKSNAQALSLTEIRTLLGANSGGYGWEAPRMVDGQKKWMRDDGAVAALYSPGVLTITSKELMAEEAAARKIERAPSLDGF